MAEAQTTRALLASSMRALALQKPLTGITVGEICQKAGMNRKSFYYHFRDKYDLVNWMFYTGFFEHYLAESENAPQTDALESLCRFLQADGAFWRSAMKAEGQNSLREYLGEVLMPLMSEHVTDCLYGQDVPKEEREFYVSHLTQFWQSAIIIWVLGGYRLAPEELVRRLYRAGEMLRAKN